MKKWMLGALCFGLVVAYSPIPTFADTATASVRFDKVTVRSGPGLQYSSIMKVNKGNSFTVVKEENGWILVSIDKDTKGWIADWMLNKESGTKISTSSSSKGNVEATTDNLNVRTGAGISYPSIGKINKGTSYPLVEEQGEWVKIQYTQNQQGWVANWLVKITKPSTEEAEEEAKEETKENTPSKEQTQSIKKEVKITATILNVRKGPSTTFESLGKLLQNDVVEVVKEENEWINVVFNGKNGWISAEFTEAVVQEPSSETPSGEGAPPNGPDPAESKPKVLLLSSGINLREGPGLEHKVITTGQKDDTYTIVEKSGDWYKISLSNGETAFVAGWVVSVVNNTSTGTPGQQQLPNALNGKTIVIDAGHGGHDGGAIGAFYKTYEKDVNLAVSKLLASKLTALGAHVYMTRDSDVYLSLQNRVDLAVAKRADAFISIHHNTNVSNNINGSIVYYYSDGSDKDLARNVQSALIKHNGMKDMGIRYGDLHVLRENPRLAILVELAFLTNQKDETAARSASFQDHSAEGIVEGLNNYFNLQ